MLSACHYKSVYSQTSALQPQSLQSAVEGKVAQYNMLVDSRTTLVLGGRLNSEPLDFNTEKLGHLLQDTSLYDQASDRSHEDAEYKLHIYPCALFWDTSCPHRAYYQNKKKTYYSDTQPAHLIVFMPFLGNQHNRMLLNPNVCSTGNKKEILGLCV